ncbi:MAG: deoxyribonuclease IV [Deltaproteobacteria bacterium]|nr:deoxyribonuclease IV [Deltaproteobacteria bacterium]
MLLGAHMSIAGGMDKAVERGMALSCTAIQLFTKNSNRWNGKTLQSDEVARFLELKKRSGISHVIAHDSYLINLASSSATLRAKSIAALIDEMERCRTLEIPYIVIHPGAHLGSGEDTGIKNITDSLDIILKRTDGWGVDIALETTAGQGTNIGYIFEHLCRIMSGVEEKDRVKTCLDSCHIFAAGYDIGTNEGYHKVANDFNRLIGFDNLVCFHVNDSKKGLGSRVDRHEHIGNGCIGKKFFELLMNDKRFKNIPKIIETPKDKDAKNDKVNLALLKKMAGDAAS